MKHYLLTVFLNVDGKFNLTYTIYILDHSGMYSSLSEHFHKNNFSKQVALFKINEGQQGKNHSSVTLVEKQAIWYLSTRKRKLHPCNLTKKQNKTNHNLH